MIELRGEPLAERVDGAVDFIRRPDSVQPIRMPAAERPLYDPFARWVAAAASGVRIRFRTDATALELDVFQRVAAAGADGRPRPAAYELYVDGRLHARSESEGGARLADDGGLIGDPAARVRFEGLRGGDCELWLPPTATVALRSLRADGAWLAAWPDARPRIVFHGSSITHAMEAEGGSGAWPAVACAIADARLLNLGWAGSCLMSGLAARMIADQAADAIVLKLGINLWSGGRLVERTFRDAAQSMLAIIRDRRPTTPLVVISPIRSPGRDEVGDRGGPSLAAMREILGEVVAARIAVGDGAIRYVCGLSLLGAEDDARLPDCLHPDATGQTKMGQRFAALALSGPGGLLADRAKP